MKKIIYIMAAVTGIALGVLLINNTDAVKNYNPSYFITNFDQTKVKMGGDFTLTKHDGSNFKFSSVKGKPSLLYFGFTHCPDFCPTSLQIMDAVSEKVDINRIFTSVDPERDTVAVLSEYVKLYKQGLIALTGDITQTDAVAKQWKIYYSFNKQNKDDMNYTVDHTTYLYLTDKNGHIVALIRSEATANDIIAFIKNM